MLTLIKQLQLYVKNVIAHYSNKHSTSEKPQDSLQVQEKHPIYRSRSLAVKNADTSTMNSNRRKGKIYNNYYSGIQDLIYDMEDDAKASLLEKMD